MKTGTMLGYFLSALLLIIMAPIIKTFELWTAACNWTIPWLCSAIALSVILVLIMSSLSGLAPTQFSLKFSLSFYLSIILIAGIGIVVDSLSQGVIVTEAFFVSMAEWLGFSVIWLLFLLVLRMAKTENGGSEST